MLKRLLITGSSGMLGVDLWQELGNKYQLFGIDSHPSSIIHHPSFNECDITDGKTVRKIFDKIKPEVVIHTAAWTDVDGCELDKDRAFSINSQGTENVVLACKDTKSSLIYISTDFVFDGEKRVPYVETDETGPVNVYGHSKLKGEEVVKRILSDYCILRTSWLYGKNGKNFVDTITAKARSGKELKVVDDQFGSPTYTKDLAKAISVLLESVIARRAKPSEAISMTNDPSTSLRACERLTTNDGIYHVSNSGSVSWYDYAREIIRIAGLNAKAAPISTRELNRPAKRPAYSVLDNSKFEKLTGHRMRNWADALNEYLSGKGVTA